METTELLEGPRARSRGRSHVQDIADIIGCSDEVFVGERDAPFMLSALAEIQQIWCSFGSDMHREQLLAFARRLQKM